MTAATVIADLKWSKTTNGLHRVDGNEDSSCSASVAAGWNVHNEILGELPVALKTIATLCVHNTELSRLLVDEPSFTRRDGSVSAQIARLP
jgi:hypothetical protein